MNKEEIIKELKELLVIAKENKDIREALEILNAIGRMNEQK